MKKYYITIGILLVLLVTLIGILTWQTQAQVGEFSLEECSFYLWDEPADYGFGEIASAKEARAAAEAVWVQVYGEDAACCKPYSVYYDGENTAWLVHGNHDLLAFYYGIYVRLGGEPYVILNQEDGQVLAAWHTR